MSLLTYNLWLSWRNFVRMPGFYLLVAAILAIGCGLMAANIAIISTMTSDPLPEKSDVLYSVSLNRPNPGIDEEPYPASLYRDAKVIIDSNIPTQTVIHYTGGARVRRVSDDGDGYYFSKIRATNRDFFSMMLAPFAYGSPWESDNANDIVLGHDLNQSLFSGKNSVGELVEIGGKIYRVVGVLRPWQLRPVFYDAVGGNAFADTAGVFIPIERAIDDNVEVQSKLLINSGRELSGSRNQDWFFLQIWVQLDNEEQKNRLQVFLDSYCQDLKKAGEHPLEIRNEIISVERWLDRQAVVDKKLLAFSVATLLFLLVCMFNASSLLLARSVRMQFETALRRSVGANKKNIFLQGVVENSLLGLFIGLLSIVLAWLFLKLSIDRFPGLENIANLSIHTLAMGFGVALLTALVTAFYPIYHSCRFRLKTELDRGH